VANDSRDRMVRSAAALIGTRGANSTSFSDVLAASGAPRGSIYHHFPCGKAELVEAAVRWTSDEVLAHQLACAAASPHAVLEHFIDLWRQVLSASNGRAGCPIAGAAIDAGGEDQEVLEVARVAFGAWTDLLARQLVAAGLSPEAARATSVTTVAGLEGAMILCRTERSTGPLETVARALQRLLATETVVPIPPTVGG
jgi:TetR/AcrR family transcriptional regulator, lmrAB and yxaGH operons repressor